MDAAKLISEVLEIRTGRPRPLGRSGVTSAIDKQKREGRVWIDRLGIDGDEQAETVIHGGPYQAVLQYAIHHYDTWRRELPDIAERFGPGGFGENIVAGILDEHSVCIGDIVRIGGALMQVTQSRQPCFKLNHRFGRPFMSRRSQESFRTGWFYAVLEPGWAEVGDAIDVLERPSPEWPVSRVQHYLYIEPHNMDAARELANLEPLAPKMRSVFAKRAESAEVEEWEDRLWNRPPVAEDEPDWFDARVEAVWFETPAVKRFRLVRADGSAFPQFDPGAHIDLRLSNGLVRHYSLCNLAADGFYEIAVGLSSPGGGGSRLLHDQIDVGSVLPISRPRNSFPAMLGAKPHVMIAGGIGITPFLSMIRGFEQTGDNYELHFCARSREVAPFLDLLETFRKGAIHLHFTDGDPAARLDVEALLRDVDPNAHVYCCGPASLMDAVYRASRHWPARNIHFESFAPPAAKGVADCTPFQIKIASTGQTFDVPGDSSILEVLREAGIALPSSCESGTCGTCKVGYRKGTVDHRDYFLSQAERRTALTACVSRATSATLTLDL